MYYLYNCNLDKLYEWANFKILCHVLSRLCKTIFEILTYWYHSKNVFWFKMKIKGGLDIFLIYLNKKLSDCLKIFILKWAPKNPGGLVIVIMWLQKGGKLILYFDFRKFGMNSEIKLEITMTCQHRTFTNRLKETNTNYIWQRLFINRLNWKE